MKFLPCIWLAFPFVATVTATPQISVEVSGAPLSSGAVLDFGGMLGEESDVVPMNGGMPGTVVISGLPPGDYLLQRSTDGIDNFSVLPGGPFQPSGTCDIRYDDPELEFSFRFFYRALADPLVRPVTLKNSGTTDLTITGISIDSGDPAVFDFDLGFVPLPLSLAAGASETIEVNFRAFGVGARAVTLLIASDSAAQSAFTLELNGEGLALGSCEPSAPPILSGVSILPANGVAGARLSGQVSGTPGTVVRLEASGDLGRSIPWLVIDEITLDAEGMSNFIDASDPRTESVNPPQQWFFRLGD